MSTPVLSKFLRAGMDRAVHGAVIPSCDFCLDCLTTARLSLAIFVLKHDDLKVISVVFVTVVFKIMTLIKAGFY